MYVLMLLVIVDLIDLVFALLSTSSLVINSFHLMFRRLRKHPVWKLANFSSICLVVFKFTTALSFCFN